MALSRGDGLDYGTVAGKVAKTETIPMYRLRRGPAFLLVLSLRLHDLLPVHGREPVGHDLQRHHLDLP
ncbi:MAG: hypothetical protein KBH99_11250 [Syntrophobacteraceae bacterium]|nr:hypothetical protein [Syntrophobacteraceae bacterium]